MTLKNLGNLESCNATDIVPGSVVSQEPTLYTPLVFQFDASPFIYSMIRKTKSNPFLSKKPTNHLYSYTSIKMFILSKMFSSDE